MKKRIISIILTLCMVLMLLPTTVFADTPISDFLYGVSTDGQVTILKYNGMAADVTIPDEIDGKPVTEIGANAFENCTSLVSVTIPSSVQTIGWNAFENCTSLTSVTIPGSVTSLGQYAFQNCTSLTSITIPGSVISIGEGAFIGCTGLASITIQSGVQTIERNAFENCTSLTSVTIPSGVQTIGQNAFFDCKSLASVTIPGSVVAIPNGAFWGCKSLTSITIPDSVTSIGISAFRECTSLAGITIPGSVTSIGQLAFFGCTSLASITVDKDNNDYLSVGGVLFSKDHVLRQYPMGNTATSYSIPDGVTSIGAWAFQDCTSLASITIPSGVETIEMCAFMGCTSLTSVAIPSSVVSIADSAFESCTSLESIFLSDKDSLSVHDYAIPSTVTQVKYSFDETAGKVTITAVALGTDKTGVTIPATICGYPVVAVSDASLLSKISSHTCADGQATCQNKAICGICKQEYGELADHNYTKEDMTIAGALKTAGTCETEAVYYYSCIYCNLVEKDENHTFTGSLDPDNHSGTKVWTTTETQHKQYWNCCDAVEADYEDHTWSEGVCSKCDYACQHKDESAKDHICDICGATASGHTGGEATCTSKAICEYCGEEYGELDSTNHDLEKVPAKNATVTETGNKAYWHCKDCNKFFNDENGTNEIKLDDTVISKLPPEIIEGKGQSITAGEKKELIFKSNAAFSDFIRVDLDGKNLDEKNYTVKEGSTVVTLKADYVATLSAGEHTIGIVSESGIATATFTVNAKAVVNNDTKSPQTGDNNNIALWIALLFVGGGLLTVTGVYGKRKTQFKN